jgi:hypothetical protein
MDGQSRLRTSTQLSMTNGNQEESAVSVDPYLAKLNYKKGLLTSLVNLYCDEFFLTKHHKTDKEEVDKQHYEKTAENQ